MRVQVDGARLLREMFELAAFTHVEPTGKDGETAVTRIVFSKDDLAARAWLKTLYADAGLEVREDAVGNTFARWVGSEPTLPAVGTGSHIDAIPHAGMYDGTLGVLGGLEAIRSLQNDGFHPRRSIELLMLTSEEPTRFGIGCLGSRLLCGALDASRADALLDRDERTLADVRSGAGFAGELANVLIEKGFYHAWVELHIEQGPLLEREEIAIGVVTEIAAPASYRISVDGFGGHAGALLMPDRRDALCAAAEIVLAVERAALATGSIDTVATTGTLKVHPGAVNSVPSRVVIEIDVRDTIAERRESVMQSVRAVCDEVRARRGVTVIETQVNADEPAQCDTHVLETLISVCGEAGLSHRKMVSRAYHDSLFMARLAPIAMIFVPCRGGVSHRPDEYCSPRAMEDGVRVLAGCLRRLAE